jgi:hypothetical protein
MAPAQVQTNGNGGHPAGDQEGWSRIDQVMDGSAPSGIPGQPVDENFVRDRFPSCPSVPCPPNVGYALPC